MDKQKTIGIIGFGAVGKSALSFFRSSLWDQEKGIVTHVWDCNRFSKEQLDLLNQYQVAGVAGHESSLKTFCQQHNYLLVSPGVDISHIPDLKHKILTEAELAAPFFSPLFAITGTLAKTSVRSTLGYLATVYGEVIVGGNSGIALLECAQRSNGHAGVIELSSFQLEQVTTFSPRIAIWTNAHQNHLDRHGSFDAYINAKFNIFRFQSAGDTAVVGDQVCDALPYELKREFLQLASEKIIVTTEERVSEFCKLGCAVVYKKSNELMFASAVEQPRSIFDMNMVPPIGFVHNWLFALTALHAYYQDLAPVRTLLLHARVQVLQSELVQEHRLELFLTINDVYFYNDSKATVTQATRGAIAQLSSQKRPLVLIVGGTGKGVDRTEFFVWLETQHIIKKVIYFGPCFASLDKKDVYSSLDDAVAATFQCLKPGDIVLFSPSGASFDLYTNYIERGKHFKQLVNRQNQRLVNSKKHCNEIGQSTQT